MRINLRAELDIASAHDLLADIIQGHISRINFSPEQLAQIEVALGALCWALQHDCKAGEKFAANVAAIEAQMKEMGYVRRSIDDAIERWIESDADLGGLDDKGKG